MFIVGYAGSIKNQVGDGDGNRTADPKKAVKTLGKQTLALDDVEGMFWLSFDGFSAKGT